VKIFGWAADDAGPGFYRLRVPLDELARHTDHKIVVDTQMPDWVIDEADVVIGQRVAQPGAATRWARMADGLYGHRPLMVFEIDDDLWEVEPHNGPAWRFYRRNPAILQNLTVCARAADVCTVSTERLAEVVRKINPNVVVLPNQLPAPAFNSWVSSRGHPVRFGWQGGVSHRADVDEMVPALRQHFRRRPDDRFLNFGTLFDSVASATAESLHHAGWTPDMREHYARVARLDVGLAPLRPSVFNQSKSELKFLEYAAAGAVTIASKFGPYEREVTLSRGGIVVGQPHEWTRAMRSLAKDTGMREELGALGRRYAETRRIDHHWKAWADVYDQG
jgi:glycosyltransferase involved in cell wall biosynthesis